MVRIQYLVICNLLYVFSRTLAIEEVLQQKFTKLTKNNERQFSNYLSKNPSSDDRESSINSFTVDVQRTLSRSSRDDYVKMNSSTLRSEVHRGKSVSQWEDLLFLSSSRNDEEKNSIKTEDDDKKTLAQQVKEGKYGLLQNEIYKEKPKRPGVLSYLSNPEVPKDSVQNFGGLDREEIWLAENHLLVLRGGDFPEKYPDGKQPPKNFQEWSPIDNYEAPKRQVKIPSMPKIPPPFPVQLTDNEPVKILESNNMESDKNKSNWFSTLVESNSTDETRNEKKNVSEQVLTGVVGPFFSSLPPSTISFHLPNNGTDYNEDDQSIYYPPAYTFIYYQDNSTVVPPGPLVPGIILPPPPNFFSKLEEKLTTTPTKEQTLKYNKRPTSSKSAENQHDTVRKIDSYKITYSSAVTSNSKEVPEGFTVKSINNFNNSEIEKKTKSPKRVFPVLTPSTNNIEKPGVHPMKSTLRNQVLEPSILEKNNCWTNTRVSSKTASSVMYYPTSTPSTANEVIEATPLSIQNIIESDKHSKVFPIISPYYFYEKNNDNKASKKSKQSPYKENKDFSDEAHSMKPYDNFQLTSLQQNSRSEVSLDSELFLKAHEQTLISEKQPSYYQPVIKRQKQFNIQNLLATPMRKEKQASGRRVKSNPVYQYSFEATDYSEHGRKIKNELQNDVVFNEWREVQNEANRKNSDYNTEIALNQKIKPDQSHYRSRLPIIISSTKPEPLDIDTTSNPKLAYYTKQDETYLDDVTREYFTNFGKKIKPEKLLSTTPIYGKTSSITVRPEISRFSTLNSFVDDNYDNRQIVKSPMVDVHYGDQPQNHYLLKDNTKSSNKSPFLPINQDTIYQHGYNSERKNLELQRYLDQRMLHKNSNGLNQNSLNRKLLPNESYNSQQEIRQPISISSKIPLFQDTPDFPSRPISLSTYFDSTDSKSANQDKRNLYFAYQLPGDGGHFYFLTPHAITQKFSQEK